jgi:AraC-like DNA-binding protein
MADIVSIQFFTVLDIVFLVLAVVCGLILIGKSGKCSSGCFLRLLLLSLFSGLIFHLIYLQSVYAFNSALFFPSFEYIPKDGWWDIALEGFRKYLHLVLVGCDLCLLLSLTIFGLKETVVKIDSEEGGDSVSREKNTLETVVQKDEDISIQERADYEALYKCIVDRIDETKCYTNAHFTLVDLASMMGIHHRKLSYIINKMSGSNFNAFINKFRVEEAKRIMRDPEKARGLTLDALGVEAGFKSKSSLYVAFKRFEGTTPGKFMHDF